MASAVGLTPALSAAGALVVCAVAMAAVMRARAQLRRTRARGETLARAFENMAQGLVMYDADHRLIAFNNQARETFGLRSDQVRTGMTLREVVGAVVEIGTYSHRYAEAAFAEWDALIAMGTPVDYTRELADGKILEVSHRPMRDGGWVTTYKDISDRRRAEERIDYLVRHDAPTGLPNERLFREHLEAQVAGRIAGQSIGVMCIGLSGMELIGGALGRDVGEAAMKVLADLLAASLPETAILARSGTGEFAIALPGLAGPAAAEQLARTVLAIVERPVRVAAHNVAVGPHIGVAMLPEDAADAETVLKCAHVALAQSTDPKLPGLVFFAPGMNIALESRRTLELDLRQAMAEGEFCLHYQPIVDLRNWTIDAVEALLRWKHPRHGLLGPTAFLSIAEEIGLTTAIGEWVLRQACAEAAGWDHATTVCVNLSAPHFLAPDIDATVQRSLAAADLPAGRLALEITETALLKVSEAVGETFIRLRGQGIAIALDDFGIGFSSLDYLRRLTFDKIKVDRSFVVDDDDQGRSLTIIRAIVDLGRNFGMAVIAEGVEDRHQLARVLEAGCGEAQGYLFSPPLASEDLNLLIARWDKDRARSLYAT